ncbi:FecR domain-containing protein [Neorhizobium alkalisoli]|uniref:FecR family protein n=1 Tax=Neorhizobium alkalisoli TaxID=528178 RepID=A0A561Q7K2_9HYPH|nr:FecR domain-containing protein [Neorhizobium alkalisoli]TWF46338.1 FecR family protein [Neorhizobium alkalisoli]
MLPGFACGYSLQAMAEPLARTQPAAGAVIARKAGEEVRFIDVSDWRFVDLKQDLVAGDILRTNETGQLAVLFSDRTQVRLGRNSTLVVKQITEGTSSDTVLQLQTGTIWARAERGGTGVKVETAAAAAAIRGTDWTMTVNGANTSLTVLEGKVQLSNPQGSVDVAQGEGAVASIGQAPRKVVIVDSDDREQMLYYMPARGAFNFMPASTLPVADMRREADRVARLPETSRSADDILTLAETQLSLDGREAAQATIRSLSARRLSGAQQARVDLMLAIFAAAEGRYDEADRLFSKASAHLDAKRGNVAVYGRYYARSLGNPKRVEPAPTNVSGPYGALLKAYTAGFLKDISAAIAVIKEAEKQYPNDPTLPAYRSQYAILLNDREQVEEALGRALSLDPNEPTALEARANYRSDFKGDLTGALADLMAATKVAPGSTTLWNAIGNVQAERGDDQAAEKAFRKSIALDPNDPVAYSNLANLYLNQYRVKEARALIDQALKIDPSFDLGLVDRGRYHLQTGEVGKGIDDMLAGTVANPAYSQGQTLLAIAHYENGDKVAGGQALDNADRLDNNDPAISSFRTALAIDEYDAEGAMRNAREYLKRSRAKGGDYASLGASQDAGSTLNSAFRLQGLDAWGQYYGDVVFDPFSGAGYIDQTLRGSVNPLANSYDYGGDIINNTANSSTFSSLIQGLMLEPHMIAGRSRSANLAQRPFLEGSIGGGFTATQKDTGWIGSVELQSFSNEPFPVSTYLNFDWSRIKDTTREVDDGVNTYGLPNEIEALSGTGYLTASLTPDDRLVAYFSRFDNRNSLDFLYAPPTLTYPYTVDTTFTTAGLGLSHTIGYHNIVNAALFYTATDSDVDDSFTFVNPLVVPYPVFNGNYVKQRNYIAAVSHSYGVDDLTLRYGAEGGLIDIKNRTLVYALGVPLSEASSSAQIGYGRLYGDVLYEISDTLKAEAAVHGVLLQGGAADVRRIEPRIGLAWAPAEGHWLRAGYMRQGIDLGTPTLSPIGIVGMQPNAFGSGINGYVDTFATRWDAEWNTWLFTAVDYQHQIIRDLSIADVQTQDEYDYAKATIDRVSGTANIALGHGFGLATTYAYADTRHDRQGLTDAGDPVGSELPFIARHSGQVAVTWVNEANVKATLAANYIGTRQGDDTAERIGAVWTLDAHLTWEPFDKRFELEAAAYNLTDEDFQVASGANGWGRIFTGTLKVRF